MFPYIRPQPVFFWDFDIKMHENDNKWYLNQFRWFWSLFFINRKQSPGGAWVGKFKKISQKLWYLHYLTRFRGERGIKRSKKLQRIWFWVCFALKLDYIWRKYEKPQKNEWILVSFPHFCRFFNSSWVLAQNNTKFIFIEVFCFIWHPTHPWIWLNSVWKELKTFLAVCLMAP